MTSSLNGLRVWITRPEPSATRSLSVWQEAGADVFAVPLVSLVAQPLSAADVERLRTLPRPWNVVLTSQNAARFLVEATASHEDLSEALHDADAFAVGEATAAHAATLGLTVVDTAPRATGLDLAEMLSARLSDGDAVVLPGSDVRRQDVPEALSEAGIVVTSVVVYHNLPVTELDRTFVDELAGESTLLALLYSPSAVRALTGVLEREHIPFARLFAGVVGPTTRWAAEAAGLRVVAAPDRPGEAALVQSVVAWWNARSS